MKEEFLHYVWQYKKFNTLNLKTVNSEPLTIVNTGHYNGRTGPDFFNAQLILGNQRWAGNVEIHLKSSDWYIHNHQNDPNYDSVILHVVWEHDVDVLRNNNEELTVLILKDYVDERVLDTYHSLSQNKSWIFCENQLPNVDPFIVSNWLQNLFVERLERKSVFIFDLLKFFNSDWESVLFCLLAKNFGLNSNGNAFLQMAKSIPFPIIRKESFDIENLEALFFGSLGLLAAEKEDVYHKNLKTRFEFLKHKYQLDGVVAEKVEFFKHRPDNFPTIRLAQLASLYHQYQNLFSLIVECKSVDAIAELFTIHVSDYWRTHYLFDKISPKKQKLLSKSFINLLIINTIVPVQFAYAKNNMLQDTGDIPNILNDLVSEKNVIIDKFKYFGIVASNALESQSLIQLKKEYCDYGACLRCRIGAELLK